MIQVPNAVNDWRTMELPRIWLHILRKNCTKEMSLPREMLPLGQALAILLPSLEPFWQTLTGEDIGQLLLSPQFTS